MKRRVDGSIQSSNIPTPANLTQIIDTRLYRGIVSDVHYVEDSNLTLNAPNPRVLYDVVILGGASSGQILTNCRLSSDLGGSDNLHEIVLKATTKKLNKTPLADHDGDIVLVSFIQGDLSYPMIVALDNGLKTGPTIGSTSETGIRELRHFNGVVTETTKDGDYSFSRQGGTETDGSLVLDTGDPKYKLELLKEEKLTETFKSGMKRETDGESDTYVKTYNGGLVVTEDGSGDQMNIVTSTGTKIDVQGSSDKVILTTAAGAVVDVNGPGGTITLTHGATVITINGTSGKITLSGDLIDVGSAVSDFVVLATELIGQHNSHFHQAPQAPSGTLPTTPPTSPMMPTVMSTTVKVQP